MRSKTLFITFVFLFSLVLITTVVATPAISLSSSAATVDTTVIITASANDPTTTLDKIKLYRNDILLREYDCRHRNFCTYIRTEIEIRSLTHNYTAKILSDDGTEIESNKIQVTFNGYEYAAPKWSNINFAPASPLVYDPNTIYSFYSTWELSDWYPDQEYVYFQSNHSGTVQDYSTTRNVYDYTYTATGIPAGTFIWKIHATDEAGGYNVTEDYNYTILKANPTVTLSLDNAQNNLSVAKLSTIIAEVDINPGEDTDMNIYQNNTLIKTIRENIQESILMDEAGYFEIKLEYPGTNNYNPVNISLFVNVTDIIAPGPVSNISGTATDYSIHWDWINPSDSDLDYTIVTFYDALTDTIISTQNITSPGNQLITTGLNHNTTYYTSYQTVDTSGNTDVLNIVNSSDVTTVYDSFAPLISILSESPADPITYNLTQLYQFNATVSDSRLDTVWIEHNFTGIPTTNIITTNISYDYYFDVSTIAAGNYYYRWFANDTAGNEINTTIQNYNIEKITSACTLTVNPISQTSYGIPINASCSCTNIETPLTLWRNGTDITSTNNQNVTLGAGSYEYFCNVSQSDNYTSANSGTPIIKVIDKTTSTVSLLLNGNHSNITINHPEIINASFTSNVPIAKMYLNNTADITVLNNVNINWPAGNHNFTVSVAADQNTTASSTILYATINKYLSMCSLNITPSTGLDDYTVINQSCTCDNAEATPALWRNNIDITTQNNQNTNLAAGNYSYICNVSETSNYNAATDKGNISVTFAPRRSGNIIINEFFAFPASGDWIEIYNNDSITIDVSGWTFNDSTGQISQTPSGLLNPGEFQVISVANRLNGASGDTIYLNNGSGAIIDTYTYATAVINETIGRYLDGTNNWFAQEFRSPNSSNTGPDLTSPTSVSGLSSTGNTDSWISWNWTNPTDSDYNQAIIYINGANIINLSTPTNFYDHTGLTQNTAYTITIHTIDLAGNENITDVNNTVTTNFTPDTVAPATISGLSSTAQADSWIYWTWTNPTVSDPDFKEAIVYIDGIWQENTTNNFYNHTNLTPSTNYTITVHTIDMSNNINNTDVNNTTSTALDTTAPLITITSPTNGAELTKGTTSTTIQLTTDEIAICRYNTSNQAWANMSLMDNTTGTIHNLSISGLSNGNTYNYYFICEDTLTNRMSSSHHLQFSVQASSTGGSSGRGSSGGSSSAETFYINLTKQGIAVIATRNDKIMINFQNQEYETKVASIQSSLITISIPSIPETYLLGIGDEIKVDLDKDGKEDASITLNKIISGKATIIYSLIGEEKPFLSSIITTIPSSDDEDEEKTTVRVQSKLAGVFREELDSPEESVGAASAFLGKVKSFGASPYTKYIITGFIILILAIAIISGISPTLSKKITAKKTIAKKKTKESPKY